MNVRVHWLVPQPPTPAPSSKSPSDPRPAGEHVWASCGELQPGTERPSVRSPEGHSRPTFPPPVLRTSTPTSGLCSSSSLCPGLVADRGQQLVPPEYFRHGCLLPLSGTSCQLVWGGCPVLLRRKPRELPTWVEGRWALERGAPLPHGLGQPRDLLEAPSGTPLSCACRGHQVFTVWPLTGTLLGLRFLFLRNGSRDWSLVS